MKQLGLIIAIIAVAVATWFASQQSDWDQKAQELAATEDWEACHYEDEDGIAHPHPDGTQCRPAQCIVDGQVLHELSGTMVDQHWIIPRGLCAESGTVCSGTTERIPCAPNEVCIILEEGSAGGIEETPFDKQAVCADD